MCVCVTQPKNTPWTHLHLLSTEDGRRLCWNMLAREALLHKQQLHKTGVVKAFQIQSPTSFIINLVIVFYQPHAELHSDSLYFLFHRRLYESTITGWTGLMAEQYNKKKTFERWDCSTVLLNGSSQVLSTTNREKIRGWRRSTEPTGPASNDL